MEAKLSLTRRHDPGKGVARKLRRAGRVPGVVYGGTDEGTLVSMEAQEALHLFQNISVDNTIIDLTLDDEGLTQAALVREIQVHPFRTELIHVDFLRVREGVAIEVQIPINLEGTPEGVRSGGGLLEHIVHDLPVRCIPSKTPETIDVDVTGLDIGDILRAGDITMPEGVENLLDPHRTICHVAQPKVADEDVAVEGEEEAEGVAPEAATDSADAEGSED